MKRRRIKQTLSLEERLAAFAKEARDRASLATGREKDELLKKATIADAAATIQEWMARTKSKLPEWE